MKPVLFLYTALALYGAGTLAVLAALWNQKESLQRAGRWLMTAGLIPHTIFIGTICSRTGHPPITNLHEITLFLAWCLLVGKLLLDLRFKVRAASFFVYPLVLILVTISAVIGEQIAPLDPQFRSWLFTSHLLLTTLGLASLLIAIGFNLLYLAQERSLKAKKESAVARWIPSLKACDLVSWRALTAGFSLYTLGILAGVLWGYRSSTTGFSVGTKEIGAIAAWIFFAVILQSYLDGSFRTQKKSFVLVSLAFVSVLVALFGISHGTA